MRENRTCAGAAIADAAFARNHGDDCLAVQRFSPKRAFEHVSRSNSLTDLSLQFVLTVEMLTKGAVAADTTMIASGAYMCTDTRTGFSLHEERGRSQLRGAVVAIHTVNLPRSRT
jgi:hypothetical protein